MKIMFNKFKDLIKLIKSIKYNPFSLLSRFYPEKIYSDFFIYNTEFDKTIFIAENIYALYLKKSLKVTHEFKFFNQKGEYLKTFSKKSIEYITKITLPNLNCKNKYISFTHNSYLKEKSTLKDSKNNALITQHRGYTTYFKEKNSLGSILHGNVGGIYPENINRSSMVQRNEKFIYTPMYKFSKENNYDLVFNNPTQKQLLIEIFLNYFQKNKTLYKQLTLNPFGTNHVAIRKYSGKISFISKLAICRCVVFKNPDINEINFDVFHS